MTSYLDITAHYRQYEKTQQNLRASLGNLFISKESKLTPLKAAFFCLKCLIGYTRYGRSGRNLRLRRISPASKKAKNRKNPQ